MTTASSSCSTSTSRTRIKGKNYSENNVNTGPLREIPEICVDHFSTTQDLKSTAFFLTHAHTGTCFLHILKGTELMQFESFNNSRIVLCTDFDIDLLLNYANHMVGLETLKFRQRLYEDKSIRLYCHAITPILINSFGRYLGGKKGLSQLIKDHKVVPLNSNLPITLEIPSTTNQESQTIQVTLLPAGHSPGSVMYFFESKAFSILYTGDCRLTLEDLKKIDSFYSTGTIIKRIDHLYVDTTFCSTFAEHFPCRKKAFEECMKTIGIWIESSNENIIHLIFSAKFAHEYVLKELYKRFGLKVHVNRERYKIYAQIKKIGESVTTNANETSIHLCKKTECVSLKNEKKKVMSIKLSSMWYIMSSEKNKKTMRRFGSNNSNSNNMTLCYSMHSSLMEIAIMIDYLKPSIVTPLVRPVFSDLDDVNKALRSKCEWDFQLEDYTSNENEDEDDILLLSDNDSIDLHDLELVTGNNIACESPEKRQKIDSREETPTPHQSISQETNTSKISYQSSRSPSKFDTYHFSSSEDKNNSEMSSSNS